MIWFGKEGLCMQSINQWYQMKKGNTRSNETSKLSEILTTVLKWTFTHLASFLHWEFSMTHESYSMSHTVWVYSNSRVHQICQLSHLRTTIGLSVDFKTVFRWKLKRVDWRLRLKKKKKMILKLREKQRKLNFRPTLRLFPLQEFQSPTVRFYRHQERGVVFKFRYLEPS